MTSTIILKMRMTTKTKNNIRKREALRERIFFLPQRWMEDLNKCKSVGGEAFCVYKNEKQQPADLL